MSLKQKKKCNACKVTQCLEYFTEDLKDTCKYCSLKEDHCTLKEEHRREVLRLQKPKNQKKIMNIQFSH